MSETLSEGQSGVLGAETLWVPVVRVNRLKPAKLPRLFKPLLQRAVTLQSVAPSAAQSQVAAPKLLSVKTHALVSAPPVVLVALWKNAVKLKALRGPAVNTATSKLAQQLGSCFSCPGFRSFAHACKATSEKACL